MRFLQLLISAIETRPSFRRRAWQCWYQHLAGYRIRSWTFMNYGYVSSNESQRLLLTDAADEDHRNSIQLYHRVVAAADLQDAVVLEVGCGRGGGAEYIARCLKPKSLTAVDYSVRQVEFCRQTHQAENLTFVCADADALPFEDGSFDIVVNVESSHCYRSVPDFLNEVARVLRPGGRFLFADFRTPSALESLRQSFGAAGMTILEEEDISANVVQALESDDERKRGLIQQHIPRWLAGVFRQFAGVKESTVYDSFKNGSLRYIRCVAEKPAAGKA